jgi:peptide/nickel transport system permease protein
MPRYLLFRIGTALIVIVGVATLVFFLIHLIPGDPVDVMLGESASASDRVQLRQALQLDLPVVQQWLNYLHGLIRLDWGRSLFDRQDVAALLAAHAPATLQLTLAALGVAIATGVPLGIVAAVRRGTLWDRVATGFSLLGISIPNFWLGPLLVLLFSIALGWLPVSGREEPGSWILPAVTLGSGMAAILTRMVRSSLLDILHEDFMRTARAKGLHPGRVILRHGLPNAMLPVLTLLGLQLGALLGGAVITETLFNWPGIGLLTIESIQRRDYPLVQGCVLLISCSYVIVNLLTDLAYAWIDPRVELGGRA